MGDRINESGTSPWRRPIFLAAVFAVGVLILIAVLILVAVLIAAAVLIVLILILIVHFLFLLFFPAVIPQVQYTPEIRIYPLL